MLKDCIQRIRQRKLEKNKNELLKKMREAEKKDLGNGVETLLMERQKLIKMEKSLNRNSFQKE
jgi:hypothetical protein